uniref:Uncharacterized protein n=1 Tax=Arundo donax TaxID=35708 RepID=A0A0A9BT70_ARUDO
MSHRRLGWSRFGNCSSSATRMPRPSPPPPPASA